MKTIKELEAKICREEHIHRLRPNFEIGSLVGRNLQ